MYLKTECDFWSGIVPCPETIARLRLIYKSIKLTTKNINPKNRRPPQIIPVIEPRLELGKKPEKKITAPIASIMTLSGKRNLYIDIFFILNY